MIVVTDDGEALRRELRRLQEDGWVRATWAPDEDDGLLLVDPEDETHGVALFWDDSGAPHAAEGYHALVYFDGIGADGMHIGVVPLGKALTLAESLL